MAVEETPFFDSRVVWWPSVRKRSAWSRAGWEMAGRWLGDGWEMAHCHHQMLIWVESRG
jgi:hypothetical protein